ncbi:MAG: FAD-dependent oxidoreductase [Candidatus Heimdallarchaeaceae archaeon]
MKVVVIGHGSTGWTAATTLRAWDRKCEITVIDMKNYDVYHPCAMPYVIGGLFEDETAIIEKLNYERMKINFLRKHKATKIDRENRIIKAISLETNEEVDLEYDYVIIATGSKAKLPPIEGIKEGKNVYALKWIEDSEKIRKAAENAKNVVVIGASAIGLEVATELAHRGIDTKVLVRSRIMRLLVDPDYGEIIVKLLEERLPKLKFLLGINAQKLVLNDEGYVTKVITTEGEELETDLVIAAAGVAPEVTLAKEAGLEIGETGAIVTDEELRTSDKNILAIGDCAETLHLVSKKPVNSALATCGVRMSRVAAMTIAKPGTLKFPGTLNNFIVPYIDIRVGSVGLTETAAKELGFETASAKIKTFDKPHYMPDKTDFYFKLIVDKQTDKILGAQAIGSDYTITNLNIVALALQKEMTFQELLEADLSYAPAVNETIYPVTQALEFIARKVLRKR